jgi:hypothetical protein
MSKNGNLGVVARSQTALTILNDALLRTAPMELILTVNVAIILMLLVVQMLEYTIEWTQPALTERHVSASFQGPPRAAANPVAEPAAHYDRAA